MSDLERKVNSIKFWRAIDNGVFKYAEWLKNRSDEDYDTILRAFLNFAESTRWKFDDRIIKFVQAVITVGHIINKPLKNAVYEMATKIKNRNDSISPEDEARQKLQNKELAKKYFAKPVKQVTTVKANQAKITNEEVNLMAKRKKRSGNNVNKLTKIGALGSVPPANRIAAKQDVDAVVKNNGDKGTYARDKKTGFNKYKSNDPNWYTDLGIHTEFTIPDGWSDSIPVPITSKNGVYIKDDLTCLRMIYNINNDSSARRERIFQLYTLLKGIRGLSSMPYSMYDLYHYLNAVIFLINEYYAFLSAVKAAYLYQVNKSRWPEAFITAKGFTFSEITDNLANNDAFVRILARNISTLPLVGHIREKLAFMNLSLIPDSNDLAIATYYVYNVKMNHNAVVVRPDYVNGSLSAVNIFSGYPGRGTLATWKTTIEAAFRTIKSSDRYSEIAGDMIGAFGSSSLFVPDYDTSCLQIAPYNEMNLSQIQNIAICNLQGDVLVAESNNGQLVDQIFPSENECTIVCGNDAQVTVTNYTTWLDTDTKLKSVSSGSWTNSNADIVLPPLPGFKGGALGQDVGYSAITHSNVPDAFWTQDALNKYFYKGSEGELLEIANYRAMLDEVSISASSGSGDVKIIQRYTTMPFACYDVIVYHFNYATHQYTIAHAIHTTMLYAKQSVYSSGTDTAALRVSNWLKLIPLCTQNDWFPLVNLVMYAADIDKQDCTALPSNALYDWNIVGIIGESAFLNAKKYISYSLNAPTVKADGKNIDNIRAVYNEK